MSMEERFEKLEEQLARANRLNSRILAGIAFCMGCAVVSWYFIPQTLFAQSVPSVPKEIRAGRFVLEDEKGRIRATVDMVKSGPALRFFDENKKIRAIVGTSSTGPMLILGDESQEPHVILSVSSEGSALNLSDENGTAALSTSEDGPVLSLKDEKSKSSAILGTTKNGIGLGLLDDNGKIRWRTP